MTDEEVEGPIRKRAVEAYAATDTAHGITWARLDRVELLQRLDRARAQRDGEREARDRCMMALREKDKAMGVLFERLRVAGVDCSDLIS